MDQHGEKCETFLREFSPRVPRPLFVTNPLGRRLAAAAAVTLAIGTSLWFVSKRQDSRDAKTVAERQPELGKAEEPNKPATLATLIRLAVEDPTQLDAALNEQSRRLLPRFDREDSTLRVLAKE